MRKSLITILATMATFAALANSYTWTGGGADATSWNDENNWDPAGVPGGGDTATFTSAATIADGIVVSSDELKIYANGAVVTLNGVISGGKLDLAEGVTVNVHMLYVPDGADGWTEMPVGVYSAANMPAYISGAGSLRVRGDGIGTLLILR
ncbi:MAG: hypothetical protein IJG13_11150 [Kiritimatiellae bacterium]|nr:hypothetical protein [Kiritimatiellia bacterium]MBQ3341504.1 hypothetical protein [Kiritimatiellia bacterium]